MKHGADISGWGYDGIDWSKLRNGMTVVIKTSQQARITHLAGQCRTGSDGRGRITHLVSGWRAACGKEPGRHSAGWSEYNDSELTCPKCKRIADRGKTVENTP